MGSWPPQHTTTGFALPTGKDVVFELRADRHPQLIVYDRHMGLHQRAVKIVGFVLRRKDGGRNRLDEVAGTPSSAHPPDNFMSLFEDEVVNQVKVKGITRFSQLRPETVRPVKISLDLEV